MNNGFPKAFIWGAATSSYQIEGAYQVDGKGESVWDRFAHTPGHIKDNASGDAACEHYYRWREDVALMRDLGLQAYRFSIAWPRILPQGRGLVNQAGLDFYDQLIDELLKSGICPFVTLDHWDLPQALQDEGGWTARSSVEAFTEYARIVSQAFGDRVKHWFTHNEPWVTAIQGYRDGVLAPGWSDGAASLRVAHHLLLSHGTSVPVIRENSTGAEVGIVLNLMAAVPASFGAADRDAFRSFDGELNRWFLDPLFGRGYPSDMVAEYRERGFLPAGDIPFIHGADHKTIATPCDFLGINYYSREICRSSAVPEEGNEPRTVPVPINEQRTAIGWEIYPEGLHEMLKRVHLVYRPGKIYIAENGCSYPDGPDEKGEIHDTRRIRYFHDHLVMLRKAVEEGVPVAGYFAWSLMDNFEWSWGYTQRFGLIWVDYQTQQRIFKDSARWYADMISSNGKTGLAETSTTPPHRKPPHK